MDSDVKATRKINPRVKANPISKLLFFYMLGIFRKNYKNGLHENDLYENLDDHKSHTLGDKMERVWIQHRKHKKWALHRSFFTIFGCQFLTIGILQFIMELSLVIIIPLGIGGLVSYFDNTSGLTESDAYMYAGIMILSIVFNLFLSSQIGLAIDHMAMKMRISCSSLIYRKALRLSRTASGQTTVGQITTLLSNDVGRFDEGCGLCHYVWIAPAQIAIGTYLLYRIIGVSAFAGIGFLILFIPIQIYFGNKNATFRLRTALRTDERVRLMNEILNGIQVIKMYTWEKPFAKLISLARRYEVQAIRASFFLEAITFTLDMVLTKIAFLITIIVYVMLGHEISADTIYSAIAIYDVLRPSVTTLFAYGISSVSEIHVSMCRVQKFLNYEEISQIQLTSPDLLQHIAENGNIHNHSIYQTPKVSLKQASTKWQPSSPEYTLTDINIDVNKAQLIAVIGQVGSGKSSLFNVILKELPLSKGSMEIHGNISYASQETWLFSPSVRQNILFGEQYVEDRYRTVLKVCALEEDLAILPYGDRTIVGEKGKVLSGGQKARINLARCIYRSADIYLLDDPLSAVDTKVGKLLYEQCIANFLSDKICILITHQLQYLKSADKIIILEDGKIAGHGTYNQLQVSGLDFAKLLKEFNSQAEQEDSNTKVIVSRQNSKLDDAKQDNANPKVEEETMKSGSISLSVYAGYLRSGGNYFVLLMLGVLFIATHGTNSGADYYISEWVTLEQQSTESNMSDKDEIDRRSMIYEYSIIIVALIILAACQTTFFFLFTMRASVNLHDSTFVKISHATMRFFNLNPTGRILNRFSKDLGIIDELIPYILLDSQQILLTFCSVVVLTTIVNPWLLLPAVGVVLFFYLLRNVYLETSRSVKRIEAITRSPILSHLTASMQGLLTIRAFSAQDTLIKEFDNHQDLHSSASFLYFSSRRAFSFYLEFICAIIVSAVTISLILLQREYYGGEAGLILTQYLTITSVLEWGIQRWSALENNMTSVERILEYKKVQIEPIRKPVSTLPKHWPEYGNIIFQNVSMRYNPDEDFVLKDLNFAIHSREKVGVVGRTGAGKSSMISALFQLYDTEGSIIIDNIDTKTLPLVNLRSKISIIPQDPVLFSGTVRRNLDPFDEYNDDILWKALEQVELKAAISEMPEGLNGSVSENGSNFSIGQRQLICLARAIVRKNKILVMDEATANVDPYTDNLIQNTIRETFANCTVITIAHRLHTVMDSNRVLVIDSGTLVEFDHPYKLMQYKNSIFYSMVKTAGEGVAKNLYNIARENFENAKHPDWSESDAQ